MLSFEKKRLFCRVEVNLLHGAAQIDPGQAVLHVNIRMDEKKLVMNTYMVRRESVFSAKLIWPARIGQRPYHNI